MADDITLNSGTGGDTIAADDVGGIKHQRVKVQFGTDGVATDVSASNPLPVDNSGVTQPVSASALPLPAGAATAANQLADGHNVTVDNASGVSAVNIQDGGNSITVDGTVTANAGTGPFPVSDNGGSLTVDNSSLSVVGGGTEATAIRVTLANDSTGVISVDDNGGSLTVDGTVTASNAAGDVAHDTADSGNPLKIGAVAESTEQTAVGDGDRVNLMADTVGKLVVSPYAVSDRYTDGVTAAITGTSNTSVIAAPGAGLKLHITSVIVTNSHATVGTVVELKDGTTVKHRAYAREDGGGFVLSFPTPIVLTANTAFNAANVTTGANTYVSATGYIAP